MASAGVIPPLIRSRFGSRGGGALSTFFTLGRVRSALRPGRDATAVAPSAPSPIAPVVWLILACSFLRRRISVSLINGLLLAISPSSGAGRPRSPAARLQQPPWHPAWPATDPSQGPNRTGTTRCPPACLNGPERRSQCPCRACTHRRVDQRRSSPPDRCRA